MNNDLDLVFEEYKQEVKQNYIILCAMRENWFDKLYKER